MTVGNILAVALGGAVGSVARYLVSKYAGDMAGGSFPWGTFAVNVAGCLLIGVLTEAIASGHVPPLVRLLLVTGFCGGFTTFSTFANESLMLMKTTDAIYTLLYIGASVAAGLIAAYAGLKAVVLFCY